MKKGTKILEHTGFIKHFRSAGARRLYEAGKLDENRAFIHVPVYRGVASRYASSLNVRAQIEALPSE